MPLYWLNLPVVRIQSGFSFLILFSILPSQVAKRLEKFKTTIFTQMSMLAIKHGAINLGQGFPNFDGPDFVKEAAIKAINAGKNQYARGYGVPELNSAVAERFLKDSGLQVYPEKEVTITSGCTEAISAVILGLINPGDEVILFAPFYDSYEATLSMAGANVKAITLRPPDFAVPLEELKAAVSENTRAIMINTQHNPTGKMFTREEHEFISTLCKENDVLLFADEVYDKLAFEADHISMAYIPSMYERTVTMNSLGKMFSLTGGPKAVSSGYRFSDAERGSVWGHARNPGERKFARKKCARAGPFAR
jgi:L-glutamine---4-(methylsulfanyl)-2-oxobutanoate aminotransferase